MIQIRPHRWKGRRRARIQKARARDPTVLCVEVPNHQRGRCRCTLFNRSELPGLCHTYRITDVLPELVTDLVVRLHVGVAKTECGTRAALPEIHAQPALRGELVESHRGQIRIEAGIRGGPAVRAPGDDEARSEEPDDVIFAGRTLNGPACSGKSGGPGCVPTPHLLERHNVRIGCHPCHHLLNRSSVPRKATDIIT